MGYYLSGFGMGGAFATILWMWFCLDPTPPRPSCQPPPVRRESAPVIPPADDGLPGGRVVGGTPAADPVAADAARRAAIRVEGLVEERIPPPAVPFEVPMQWRPAREQ